MRNLIRKDNYLDRSDFTVEKPELIDYFAALFCSLYNGDISKDVLMWVNVWCKSTTKLNFVELTIKRKNNTNVVFVTT